MDTSERPAEEAQNTSPSTEETAPTEGPKTETTQQEVPQDGEKDKTGAVPEGTKTGEEKPQEDLSHQISTLSGLLKATQKERDGLKGQVGLLTEQTKSLGTDLDEALQLLAEEPEGEAATPFDDVSQKGRPQKAKQLLQQRKERAKTQEQQHESSQRTAQAFVDLVETAGLEVEDERLAGARQAETPEKAIGIAKQVIKDIRKAEKTETRKEIDDLKGSLKKLTDKLLKVDISGPSGGGKSLEGKSPIELAEQAYGDK